MKKLSVLGIIGGAALLTAVPLSLQWSQKSVSLSLDSADSADARIGRPLTPLSVTVYRRAYRGAVDTGVAGAGGYGAVILPLASYHGIWLPPYYQRPYLGLGWRYGGRWRNL